MCKTWRIHYECAHAGHVRFSTCRGTKTVPQDKTHKYKHATPRPACFGGTSLTFKFDRTKCGPCEKFESEKQLQKEIAENLGSSQFDPDEYAKRLWKIESGFPAKRGKTLRAPIPADPSKVNRGSLLKIEVRPEDIVEVQSLEKTSEEMEWEKWKNEWGSEWDSADDTTNEKADCWGAVDSVIHLLENENAQDHEGSLEYECEVCNDDNGEEVAGHLETLIVGDSTPDPTNEVHSDTYIHELPEELYRKASNPCCMNNADTTNHQDKDVVSKLDSPSLSCGFSRFAQWPCPPSVMVQVGSPSSSWT